MQIFLELLPWLSLILVFSVDQVHILYLTYSLNKALGRAQTQPPLVPVPSQEPAKPTSTAPVVVDQGLVNFIKKQEGYSAKAYWDYKQWTIGFGTRAKSGTEVIDQAEAERRLHEEIDKAYQLVKPILPPNTPIGIQQALVDLTYNAGSGWEHGSLGAAVKAGKWDTVKADILLYNHAGGQVLEALTKRRQAEVSWFEHPL